MQRKKKTVAMLLAGGQGSRLGVLTDEKAKPAVTYGGKYRIIDFPLSNCTHSGIDTVGVLTQYRPLELNTYIGTGAPWDLDTLTGGAYVLPPYSVGESGEWYSGTANAIYQNMGFIEQFDPDNLLVLSGDHIYKMNYKWMLAAHMDKGADATIAVIPVPIEEASRFGIMNTDAELRITEFEEKPGEPKNNLASMGVYVFKWRALRKYLIGDAGDPSSEGDFGRNIIPAMLAQDEKLYAYEYGGYWKDVGTIQSLWEANMELLSDNPPFNLYDDPWRVYSRNPNDPPHFVDAGARIVNSIICEGCQIYGTVENSILSSGVVVGKDAGVYDSIVMANTKIDARAQVDMSIIDEEVRIGEGATVGEAQDPFAAEKKISVVGRGAEIAPGGTVPGGKEVRHDS
ncbi:MAG: glucose-1-phosphate adenylyltransferase [Clostridiales Family XIII bacterium]|jgi:glucose-1-phosphate adenylyltransferase|nr:glucose-1-phosphate adenylyltransferase [Clostridiales Family XIII bacterium]